MAYIELSFCEQQYNKMNGTLNKELVIRLLKYRRILTQLKSLGFEKVFSNNLGDAIGVARPWVGRTSRCWCWASRTRP